MSEKDLREAFFNFVLQIASNNLASIHLHIIKEVIQESDIGLGENIKVREDTRNTTFIPVVDSENDNDYYHIIIIIIIIIIKAFR